MKRSILYALWAALFSLCAGLGFIPEPSGLLRTLLTCLSVCFFLPPALLLYTASREHRVSDLLLVRNFAALSLGLTLVLLILNFFTALGSDFLGQVLHYTLVIVSSPMVCSGHWALSLFLWACLLMGSLQLKKEISPARRSRK